jgi:8-oxo-dGTP diphosphatase
MKKDIVEVNFRVAVKAFSVNKGKLFVIKRAEDDVQSPGIWELPGGRLELGEDPYLGLIREIKEETGLYIRPINPMTVRHFERSDGQVITMLVFLCKVSGGDAKLSEEHSSFDWVSIDDCKEKINPFFHKEVEIFNELNLHRLC